MAADMADICYSTGDGSWRVYNCATGHEVWEETSMVGLLRRILRV